VADGAGFRGAPDAAGLAGAAEGAGFGGAALGCAAGAAEGAGFGGAPDGAALGSAVGAADGAGFGAAALPDAAGVVRGGLGPLTCRFRPRNGVRIERDEELAAPRAVALERRQLFAGERLGRAQHQDHVGVVRNVAAQTLGQPQIFDQIVLLLQDGPHDLGGALAALAVGRIVQLAVAHREVGHAAGAHHLQQLLLKIAVQGLELGPRVLLFRADRQALGHAALGEHDHAVLGGLQLFRALRHQQSILDLDLQVRRAAAELVEVGLDLSLDLAHLRKERDHLQRLAQALGDLAGRLAGSRRLEVAVVRTPADLVRRVSEERAVGGGDHQGEPADCCRTHAARLGALGVAHGQERGLGEQHGQRGPQHQHHPDDGEHAPDAFPRLWIEGREAALLPAEVRADEVDREGRDAHSTEHAEQLLDVAALAAQAKLGHEAHDCGAGHRAEPDGSRHVVRGGHGLEHALAQVHQDQAHDVRGHHPQRRRPPAMGRRLGHRWRRLALGSRPRFLRGALAVGRLVALVVGQRHRRASRVLVAASKKK
jgi:hypothetical protein